MNCAGRPRHVQAAGVGGRAKLVNPTHDWQRMSRWALRPRDRCAPRLTACLLLHIDARYLAIATATATISRATRTPCTHTANPTGSFLQEGTNRSCPPLGAAAPDACAASGELTAHCAASILR